MNPLQAKQFEMLKVFVDICDKYNLNYILVGGTCLGAIRHKGFIPWDDDIDIMMPRGDYQRFLQVTQESPDERYKLFSVENNEKLTAPLAKLIDKKTILNQTGHAEKMNLGLYVDIFVLDGVPDNENLRRCFIKMLTFLQKVWGGLEYEKRPIDIRGKKVENRIKNSISHVLRWLTTAESVSKKICKLAQKYNYDECSLVAPLCYSSNRKKRTMEKSIYGKGIRLEFENNMFVVPEKYETFLRITYGDYMELPPKEEQVSHHRYDLKFLDEESDGL